MADATQAFPSAFMKADDLLAGPQTLTIADVNLRYEFNDGSTKPVIEFAGGKQLVCNKTNWNLVIEMYGTNTDAWLGKPLTLTRQMVDFQGKRTPAIRINPTSAPAAPVVAPVPPAVNPAAQMKTWIAKAKMGNGHTPSPEDLAAKADELAGACYGAGVPDKVVEAIYATDDVPAKLAAMWDAVNSLIGRNQGDVNI